MGTRNVITVLGAVAGYAIAGPAGARWGLLAGSLVGAAVDPLQIEGARLEDLKATAFEYGSPVPHCYGTPRVPGIVAWASEKQETATTSGGKGGPEATEYSYKQDVLFMLTSNEIAGVRRIWANGKLIWSAADDASNGTLAASQETDAWESVEIFTGAADQLPWSVYEADVGVGNAPAMRGRGCVGITGLSLGGSGYLPQLTFEVVSVGTSIPGGVTTDGIRAIFPWTNIANVDGACVTTPIPVHGDCQNGRISVSAFAFYDYNAPSGTFTNVADCLAAIVAAAAAPNPLAAGGFVAGQTFVGFFTSANYLPSYFLGGASLADGDAEFIYLLFATGPIEAISENTSGTLCAAMIATGLQPDDDKVMVSRHDSDANVYRTFKLKRETSALPAGYIQSAGGCIAYGDGGDGFFPSMVIAPLTVVAVKRVLSCDIDCSYATYEVGGARQLIVGETYTNIGTPGDGGSLGGILDQTPKGPLLLASDPNFNNEDWWRAEALAAGVDLAGRSFMASPTDDGGTPGSEVTTRFAAFTTIGCACATGVDQITVDAVPLSDVVEDLCLRSGLEESYIDVQELESQQVRALAVTQISSARQVIEMLMGAYFFNAVESEQLKFVLRGAASIAEIPFSSTGAGVDSALEDPFPITRRGDIEIPAQVAVTYINFNADYQSATEYSDRLIGRATGVAAVQLPIGFVAQEAKRIAEATLLDGALAATSIGPVALDRSYSDLEPTDVITVVDEDGSTFRTRIVKIDDADGVRSLSLVLDDATALNSSALTDDSYVSSTVVQRTLNTLLVLGDWPIFRDVDNEAGHYAAASPLGTDGVWPGATLFRGVADASYAELLRFTDRAVIGEATTVLGDWTGGPVFDEVSRVTVSVNGTLENYTRDAILNGTAPIYMIGTEALYARTATLVSTGVYTLTGLLRGRRGTDWANGTHEVGDRFVRISTSGVRRAEMENGQLGAEFSFKAPTFGRSLAAATEVPFTNLGVGLKPFAPVDLRISRTSGTEALVIRWKRRTRLSCRLTGSLGINVPLGEAPEAYSVEIRDQAAPTVLLRTVETTSQEVTYSSAQQTADSIVPGDVLLVTVYQISAVVGRGYAYTDTLVVPASFLI
jgi:hypothetical protein